MKTPQEAAKENKLDGSIAYKVIDADRMTVLRMFHEDRRKEMLTYYEKRYKSVSEDIDRDIICSNDSED